MNEITKRNILNRWKLMANSDLGTEVQPVAEQLHSLFTVVLSGVDQVEGSRYGLVKPLIRCFSRQYHDSRCSITEQYDLDLINLDQKAVAEFDYWIMNECNDQWFERFKYAKETQ